MWERQNVPGKIGSACSDPCPSDGNWVDCYNGYVRGTDTPCNDATDPDACGTDCCVWDYACYKTTACIKKDGSCNGYLACDSLGAPYVYDWSDTPDPINYSLHVSGPSCVGESACYKLFFGSYGFGPRDTGGVVSITNSCLCERSCFDFAELSSHCSESYYQYWYTDNKPQPLPGLPACGESFYNFIGRPGYDTCPIAGDGDQTNEPTGVYQTSEPTGVYQTSEPTGVYQTNEPTGVYQTSEPTGVYQTNEPTGVYQTNEPTGNPTLSRPPSVSPSSILSNGPSSAPSLTPSSSSIRLAK